MSSSLFNIEKLDESNYDSWNIQLKSVLVHQELWSVASGVTPCPEAAEEDKNVVAWKVKDEKATATIILSITPMQIAYVKNCKTSSEAWNTLRDIHRPKGPVRKVTLFKRLLGMRMKDGECVQEYVCKFTSLAEKLEEIGVGLQEEFFVIMLLASLPKSFENSVVALESRDELPKLSAIKIKLIEEGERRNSSSVENTESTVQAFMVRENSSKMRSSTNSNSNEINMRQAFAAKSTQGSDREKRNVNFKNVTCYGCEQKGHIKSNCPKSNKFVNSAKKRQQKCSFTALGATDFDTFGRGKWCLDSGATAHMCCDRTLFSNFVNHTESIALAGDKSIRAEGKGDVKIQTGMCDLTLKDVLYVPGMRGNFISVGRAVEMGCAVSFNKKYATVKKNGDDILRLKQSNNLFMFEDKRSSCFGAMQKQAIIWHNRYGHLNYTSLNELAHKSLVHGMEKISFSEKPVCRTCMLCKIHTQPFPNTNEHRSKNLLDLVHTDVCGPFDTPSLGGSKYFLTFIDDMSRRIFVYFIKSKAEVFNKFVAFCTMVERQTGNRIKAVRSDNGGEYINKQLNDFFESRGIIRQLSVPYTPQQNGVAERANRTLVEMSRSLLVHSGMPDSLWAEAVATAAYLRNRAPTRALSNETPYEAWYGKKPSVQHLKVFGSVAVALDKTHHKNNKKASSM